MLQYKAALLAIRCDFNPILSGGKLAQRYIVDSYLHTSCCVICFLAYFRVYLTNGVVLYRAKTFLHSLFIYIGNNLVKILKLYKINAKLVC